MSREHQGITTTKRKNPSESCVQACEGIRVLTSHFQHCVLRLCSQRSLSRSPPSRERAASTARPHPPSQSRSLLRQPQQERGQLEAQGAGLRRIHCWTGTLQEEERWAGRHWRRGCWPLACNQARVVSVLAAALGRSEGRRMWAAWQAPPQPPVTDSRNRWIEGRPMHATCSGGGCWRGSTRS